MVWNLMFVWLTGDHSKYIYVIVIACCLFCLILVEFVVITRVVFVASMYLLLKSFSDYDPFLVQVFDWLFYEK